MKFFNIGSPDRFLQRVIQCRGNVYYVDGFGRQQDLKKLADTFLSGGRMFGVNQLSDIDIRMEDGADCLGMLRYAMQVNLR